MSQDISKNTLKIFFIKLIAITFSIIAIINITYNLIFAEKWENINTLLTINNKENIKQIKNKIRIESSGLPDNRELGRWLFCNNH